MLFFLVWPGCQAGKLTWWSDGKLSFGCHGCPSPSLFHCSSSACRKKWASLTNFVLSPYFPLCSFAFRNIRAFAISKFLCLISVSCDHAVKKTGFPLWNGDGDAKIQNLFLPWTESIAACACRQQVPRDNIHTIVFSLPFHLIYTPSYFRDCTNDCARTTRLFRFYGLNIHSASIVVFIFLLGFDKNVKEKGMLLFCFCQQRSITGPKQCYVYCQTLGGVVLWLCCLRAIDCRTSIS